MTDTKISSNISSSSSSSSSNNNNNDTNTQTQTPGSLKLLFFTYLFAIFRSNSSDYNH
jgi:hypothetical protein